MLAAIRFSDSNGALETGSNFLHIAVIQTKAIAGKITVGVKCDSVVRRINVPYAAVVIKVEIHIQASAAGDMNNRDDIVVALAADDSLGPGHRSEERRVGKECR